MEYVPDVSPDLPTRNWQIILALLGRLPQGAMSRSFGRIADIQLPRAVRRRVLSTFASAVGADLSEVAADLEEFPSINAFFVRHLKEGARQWPADSAIIASPVDGIIGQFGEVTAGKAIQAKGHSYSIAELLADQAEAIRYEGGSFLTIYLSPRHYHRIHTPIAGTISSGTYIPGTLLPVNGPAVMHVPRLFARNERLICYVDSVAGRIPVVAVGAYNVGRISAAFDREWGGTGRETWVTNRRPLSIQSRSYDPPRPVETGGEIMAFHLGSTIVMLFEPQVRLNQGLEAGAEVKLGAPLAH